MTGFFRKEGEQRSLVKEKCYNVQNIFPKFGRIIFYVWIVIALHFILSTAGVSFIPVSNLIEPYVPALSFFEELQPLYQDRRPEKIPEATSFYLINTTLFFVGFILAGLFGVCEIIAAYGKEEKYVTFIPTRRITTPRQAYTAVTYELLTQVFWMSLVTWILVVVLFSPPNLMESQFIKRLGIVISELLVVFIPLFISENTIAFLYFKSLIRR
jgi:hypothetical protein